MTPNINDVLLGDDQVATTHFGAVKWRLFVSLNKGLHDAPLTEQSKALVRQSIVYAIRHQTPPGYFRRKVEGELWHPVGDDEAWLATLLSAIVFQQHDDDDSGGTTTIQEEVYLELVVLARNQCSFFLSLHSRYHAFGMRVASWVEMELEALMQQGSQPPQHYEIPVQQAQLSVPTIPPIQDVLPKPTHQHVSTWMPSPPPHLCPLLRPPNSCSGRRSDAFTSNFDAASHKNSITMARLDDKNAAPPPLPPIPPDRTLAFEEEEQEFPQEKFSSVNETANMGTFDGSHDMTSQCSNDTRMMAANHDNHASFQQHQDENMIGVTIDGVPLHNVESKTSNGAADDNNNNKDVPPLLPQNTSDSAATTQAGLDFLANAAVIQARGSSAHPFSRRVSSTIGGNNGTHHGHLEGNTGKSLHDDDGTTARAKKNQESTIHFDDSAQDTRSLPRRPRRVSHENDGGQATANNNMERQQQLDDSIPETHSSSRRVSHGNAAAAGDQAVHMEHQHQDDAFIAHFGDSESFQSRGRRRVSNDHHGNQAAVAAAGDEASVVETSEKVVPDVGKFGVSNHTTPDSFDNDDSSDDGFWQGSNQNGGERTIRSKSVIHDDFVDSSPEKSPEMAERQSPRSISPTFDDSDDSDFSLSTRKPKKKKRLKKKKKRSKKTEDATSMAISNGKEKKKRKRLGNTGSANEDLTGGHGANKLVQQPNKKRGRKRLIASKSTVSGPSTTSTVEATGLQVSERVYAEWSPNDWYWGRITAKVKNRKGDSEQYSVRQTYLCD